MTCRESSPGDPINIGDMLGHGMESNLIVGRVTGFLKCPGGRVKVIYRKYRTQTEPWLSGEYRTAGLVFPHRHYSDGACERFIHPETADD